MFVCVSVSVYVPHLYVDTWLEERARFHAARVIESFELPDMGAGNKIWAKF